MKAHLQNATTKELNFYPVVVITHTYQTQGNNVTICHTAQKPICILCWPYFQYPVRAEK